MTTERFWQIIEATSAPTQEEQLERFKVELQQLSMQELIAFAKQFAEFEFAAYNWDLWLVVWLCQGGMFSDDSFSDFRSWLISRGREMYETALQDPDALVEDFSQTDNPTFERFGYVPGQCYRERTEEEAPDLGLSHPMEPAGGNWLRPQLKDRTGSKMLNRCVVFREMGDEEFDAIERQFPRLWQYCIQKGIIRVRDPNAPPEDSTERLPTPEEIAKSLVDPNLANTDFQAYLKALADAARKEYSRRNSQQ